MKRTFVHRNIFDFKHIKPFRIEFADLPGPMVLFSTPGIVIFLPYYNCMVAGMLHGGQSLKCFKKWCGDERNAIIMPGYCTAGTVGAKVIQGAKKLDIDGKMVSLVTIIPFKLCFSMRLTSKWNTCHSRPTPMPRALSS